MTKVSLYAMVDQTGRVIGLVEWDGASDLNHLNQSEAKRNPSLDFKLVPAHGAQIGWTYGSGLFTDTQK